MNIAVKIPTVCLQIVKRERGGAVTPAGTQHHDPCEYQSARGSGSASTSTSTSTSTRDRHLLFLPWRRPRRRNVVIMGGREQVLELKRTVSFNGSAVFLCAAARVQTTSSSRYVIEPCDVSATMKWEKLSISPTKISGDESLLRVRHVTAPLVQRFQARFQTTCPKPRAKTFNVIIPHLLTKLVTMLSISKGKGSRGSP